MNKTLLVFKHEFLRTLRRPGFIVLTFILPVLALLLIGVFHIISGITRPPAEVTQIGYVDEVGFFTQFTTQGNISFIHFASPESATQALVNKDIKEYFVIPPDFVSTGLINRYTTQKELSNPQGITDAIKNFTTGNLLNNYQVPSNVITRVETPLNVITTTLTSTGEVAPHQAGYANFLIPGIFSILLALSLIFSSTYVLQGLAEEKESRLMEILLSSVSTRQLLIGKVLGLGAAGLAQVIVWIISLPLLLTLASSSIGGFLSTVHVPAYFWLLGVIYFILGYALYAVLSASIAAVTSSVQEGQGLAGIYTLFSVVPLWFISLLLIFPNSPIWIVLSIFPFTAPVEVMLRLGVLGVPAWQIALSLVVLAGCVVGGLLLASKLLRTYLLLYGKRPKLSEIIRNLKSA